jgi:hypothetical protein
MIEVRGGLAGVGVFVDGALGRFGIGLELPPNDPYLPQRAASMAAGISGSGMLQKAVLAQAGDIGLELSRGVDNTLPGLDGPHATISIAHEATRAEALAIASTLGVSGATLIALGARLALLEGMDKRVERLLRVTVFPGPAGHDSMIELGVQQPATVLDRIIAAASSLSIGGPQQRLLANVHPILAGSKPVIVRCAVVGGALMPGATITYFDHAIDHARRVLSGLVPSEDVARKLGTVVGALASDSVWALELALGPKDPVPARVGLNILVR